MKANLILLLIIFNIVVANAQIKNNMKVGFDLGVVGIGLAVRIEPKYNLTDQSSVGLRLGGTAQAERKITSYEGGYIQHTEIGEFASISVLGTYDQYFHKDVSKFVWFLGGGIGYYNSTHQTFNEGDPWVGDGNVSPSLEAKVKGKFTLMVRSGFEIGKFRLTLEYNIIPSAEVVIPSGKEVGYVKDSYIGAMVGFVIGGGKWKNTNSE